MIINWINLKIIDKIRIVFIFLVVDKIGNGDLILNIIGGNVVLKNEL